MTTALYIQPFALRNFENDYGYGYRDGFDHLWDPKTGSGYGSAIFVASPETVAGGGIGPGYYGGLSWGDGVGRGIPAVDKTGYGASLIAYNL